MSRVFHLTFAIIFGLALGFPLTMVRAADYSGVCEDIFIPDYPKPGDPGIATQDFKLVPFEKLQLSIADCKKRSTGFFAPDKVVVAHARMQAMAGDKAALPKLRELANGGLAEASYLIEVVYAASPPVSPHKPEAAELTRGEAERELRRAAEAGHILAMQFLTRGLKDGVITRRDRKEARVWAEKLLAAKAMDIEGKAVAALNLAALYFEDPSTSPAEWRRLPELAAITAASLKMAAYAQWLEIRGRRLGLGWDKDEAAARRLAETPGLMAKSPPIKGEYLELLLASGQPQDRIKIVEILEAAKPTQSRFFDTLAGELLFSGKPAGRDRRRAFDLLVTEAAIDQEDAVAVAQRIVLYGDKVKVPVNMLRRLYEAVDLKLPGADVALVRLKGSLNSDAYETSDELGLAQYFGASSEGMTLYLLEKVAHAGPYSIYPPFDKQAAAVAALEKLVAKGVPAALRIKGYALRRGKIYAQDDVEATKFLIRAAEAGDVVAMDLASDAYGSGLGIAENRVEEFRWLKAAAKAGSADAQKSLVNLFPFRRSFPGYSVHDALMNGIVLFAEEDALFGLSSSLVRSLGAQDIEQIGLEFVTQGYMDGFRASMAARNDEIMVKAFKSVDKEVKRGIETVLKQEGFLNAEPDGYMGPAARSALIAWARSKGLPEVESDRPPAPPEADARLTGVPLIPPEVIKALRVKAFNGVNTSKVKAEQKKAMKVLALLAEYGDMVTRLEILKNYSDVALVREAVPPGMAAVYGIDVLTSQPPGAEKAQIDFVFAITHMEQNGSLAIAAEVLLFTLRDDPRLRNPEVFDRVAGNFVFAAGYCDELLAQAKKAKIDGMTDDGCSPASRRALLAWAKASGPYGAEAKIRQEAAAAILKLPK